MSVIKGMRKARARLLLMILFIVLTLFMVMVVIPGVSAQEAALSFLGEKVTLSPDDDGKFTGTVSVQNDGETVNNAVFKVILPEEEVQVAATPDTLEGYDTTRVTLEIPPRELSETLTGHLVVSGDGHAPGAISVALEPAAEDPKGIAALLLKVNTDLIIASSFTVAAVAFFVIWGFLGNKGVATKNIGQLNWDLKKNWASTLVAAGGILGTVVGASIIPEEPKILTEASFNTLNQVFVFLIVLAPFVGIMLSTFGKDKVEAHALWFVLAGSIVIWAVLGELATMIVLLEEVRVGSKALGMFPARMLQVVLAIVAVSSIFYAGIKLVVSVENGIKLKALFAMLNEIKDVYNALREEPPDPSSNMSSEQTQLDTALSKHPSLGRIKVKLDEDKNSSNSDSEEKTVNEMLGKLFNEIGPYIAVFLLGVAHKELTTVYDALKKIVTEGKIDQPVGQAAAEMRKVLREARKDTEAVRELVQAWQKQDMEAIKTALDTAHKKISDKAFVQEYQDAYDKLKKELEGSRLDEGPGSDKLAARLLLADDERLMTMVESDLDRDEVPTRLREQLYRSHANLADIVNIWLEEPSYEGDTSPTDEVVAEGPPIVGRPLTSPDAPAPSVYLP